MSASSSQFGVEVKKTAHVPSVCGIHRARQVDRVSTERLCTAAMVAARRERKDNDVQWTAAESGRVRGVHDGAMERIDEIEDAAGRGMPAARRRAGPAVSWAAAISAVWRGFAAEWSKKRTKVGGEGARSNAAHRAGSGGFRSVPEPRQAQTTTALSGAQVGKPLGRRVGGRARGWYGRKQQESWARERTGGE